MPGNPPPQNKPKSGKSSLSSSVKIKSQLTNNTEGLFFPDALSETAKKWIAVKYSTEANNISADRLDLSESNYAFQLAKEYLKQEVASLSAITKILRAGTTFSVVSKASNAAHDMKASTLPRHVDFLAYPGSYPKIFRLAQRELYPNFFENYLQIKQKKNGSRKVSLYCKGSDREPVSCKLNYEFTEPVSMLLGVSIGWQHSMGEAFEADLKHIKTFKNLTRIIVFVNDAPARFNELMPKLFSAEQKLDEKVIADYTNPKAITLGQSWVMNHKVMLDDHLGDKYFIVYASDIMKFTLQSGVNPFAEALCKINKLSTATLAPKGGSRVERSGSVPVPVSAESRTPEAARSKSWPGDSFFPPNSINAEEAITAIFKGIFSAEEISMKSKVDFAAQFLRKITSGSEQNDTKDENDISLSCAKH